MWYGVSAVVIVLFGVLILMSRGDSKVTEPRANRDHWHAAIGVNVCGEWLPNPATFEYNAQQSSQRVGIHTHGDGLIHIHPYVTSEAGDNATVGRFFRYGGWSASKDSFKLWDGQEHRTGDKCGDEEAEVRWELNGEPQSGNISDYHPKDGDVIALALLPAGQEIGTPPSAQQLSAPLAAEGGPGTVAPPPGTETTVPGDTTAPTETTPEAPTESTAPAESPTSAP